MKKNKKILLIAGVVILAICLALVLAFCGKGGQADTTGPADSGTVGADTTYTVAVKSSGGIAISDVSVYIYEDATQQELVWFDKTNAEGKMSFTDKARDTYVAVLSDVPTGYKVEESYPLTGELTEIILGAASMEDVDTSELTYKLGDMMMDFTVTDVNGVEYTLSQLLTEKKAVVLNFWFTTCQPCKAEFPYLQEAYDKYSDQIAVLAMNPINTQQEVADFLKEYGYTFPMIACGEEWQKLMGITAYPTTVVIDRYGNITLIHTGTIDNAKTFEDMFAHYADENYQQVLVEDLEDIKTEAQEGTAENPADLTGQSVFTVEVEPGKEVYTELYRATGMYLQVQGKDFYVVYNGTTYQPNASGVVGFMVTTGDNYTPMSFGIGNTGSTTNTYKVALSFLPGTFDNPYSLKTGKLTATIAAGNEVGVYYRCTAPEDGTYTVQCISSTPGVKYDFFLQSMDVNRTVLHNFSSEGATKDGYPTVTLEMKGGQDVLFSVGTLPDDSNTYPGGTFTFLVTFTPGKIKEVEKVEKIDYTVKVVDENGAGIENVNVWLTKDGQTSSAATNASGVATLNLEKGTYTGTIGVPEGYTLANNAFTLTETAASATVKLTTRVDTRVDYTITAVDPSGTPVAGVEVLILGVTSGVTDGSGQAVFKLEPDVYMVISGALPEGYASESTLMLDAQTLTGTLELSYVSGSVNNPIMLTETENTLTNTGTVYYGGNFSGATMTVTGQTGFSVIYNGNTVADTDGSVSLEVVSQDPRYPVTFAITGEGEFQVVFTYPVGHQMNPETLILGTNQAIVEAGATGYYYNWTAHADGELTITMDENAQWQYVVNNITAVSFGDTHWSDDAEPVLSESVYVTKGDQIQVIVNTYDPQNLWNTSAGAVTVEASFSYVISEIPFNTDTIPAGQSQTYQVYNVGGTVMNLVDTDAYVIFNGTTYTSNSEGVITVSIPNSNDTTTPTTLVIGNSGSAEKSFEVTFTWPLGHQMNPQKLVIGDNKASLEAGASGYFYTWTAPADGELTVTMDENAQWQYVVNNVTAGTYGDTYWSSDEPVVLSQTVTVSKDDTIQVIVNTYDSANMWTPPAGTVEFKASFVYVTDENPFTTDTIPAGSAQTYRVSNVGGTTMTIDSGSAYVVYGGTTYRPEDGVITVKIGKEDTTTLVIGNDGEGTQSYTITFTWPEGTYQNPKVITGFRSNTAELTADHAGHYYFLLTAPRAGNLGFYVNAATGCDLEVINKTSGVSALASRDGVSVSGNNTVYNSVLPDDEILIHVIAEPNADGTYSDADVTVTGTFQSVSVAYTVTFDANGGELTGASSAVTASTGKLAEMPADPIRTDYYFDGWFDAPEGGNAVTTSSQFRRDTTIYAQWTKIEYTVTFNANGGHLAGDTQFRTADYKLLALPADPTLEGYIFNGWFDEPIGGNQITTDTVYSANITVYAQWTEIKSDSGESASTITYSVSVIDENGAPVTNNVYVTWVGSKWVTKALNNASGTVDTTLEAGTYSILLNLQGVYADYKYDAVSAVATAESPNAVIQIAKPVSEDAEVTQYGASGGDLKTMDVPMGATYVELGSSQANYAVIDGTPYCFFRFVITEEGQYAFTTNNGAPITNWSTNTHNLYNCTTEEEAEANAFTYEVKEHNFPADTHTIHLIFAVEVTDAYTDTIIKIVDAGDAVYTVYDAPWIEYVCQGAPAYTKTAQGVYLPVNEGNVYSLSIPSGKQITYVDMLNQKAVLGSDGYYHLNSADGPLLYINLGENAPKISAYSMLGLSGFGGTLFGKIFYNEDGTPMVNADGNYVKEDYTNAMIAYTVHRDPTTGAYPLNEDLAYMIQQGGEYKGWYTPDSGTYLFQTELDAGTLNIDNDLAWMFAVFYLA